MKKKIIVFALASIITMKVNAQVFSEDTWGVLPTADLYDQGLMNAQLQLMAKTAARRKETFNRYFDSAVEALKNQQWNSAIYYVNAALATEYYNGEIYYIRGYAYEKLNNIRAAKKDYRKGKKYKCVEAALALDALKKNNKRK